MLRRLLLLVVVVMMTSPVSAAVILRVDFNSDQDGGGNSTTAGDPGASAAAHNQAGWSSYHANHEVAAEFTTANYGGITVTPAWPNTTDNRVQQSLDRAAGNDNNWDNSLGYLNLVTDWIGTDTRTGSGGKGNWDGTTGTPTYMTLTLGGLTVGSYEWTSFHHDTEHCHGPFAVWLSTNGGTTFIQLADGLMTDGTTGGTPDSGTIYSGPDPCSLPSTYRTTFVANGVDNVVMRFAPYSNAAGAHRQIWGINGFELNQVESKAAIALTPLDEAADVLRDGTILSWKPGEGAVAHDVYLGVTHDEVDDGMTTSASYKGREDVNNFDPGRLVLGQTYYWRVDEVAADGTITKSRVWNFIVEPVSIALGSDLVTATASSFALNADPNLNSDPNSTIDGSGLSTAPVPLHSIDVTQMWLSDAAGPEPTWIQYEFDRAYKLHEMWVWNYNGEGLNAIYGFKGLAVEYSVDGVNWKPLEGVMELPQAPGTAQYTPSVVNFGNAVARYVKLTATSNWSNGWFKQSGLSEVRFMVIPAFAREPRPDSGATNADPRAPLSWRAGREVAVHNVYLSEDVNAVIDGTALVATVSEPSFDASAFVTLGKTYYWKIDEVNEAGDSSVWQGDVWSFTVPSALTIEDFETYTNDSPNRVFQTWIDGAGFSADEFFPQGHSGNGTGSYAGYNPEVRDIMETVFFHGGVQSMPLEYSGATSETERTFSEPQDWTRFGAKSLVIWFFGDADNAAAQMYVKVNGKKVMYDGSPDNVMLKPWQPWRIDLTTLTGVDLRNVTKLAVGLEGGQGIVCLDDISLSPEGRQLVAPVKPAATNLVAYYGMEGNVNSSTGTLPGTVVGAPTYTAGKVGQAIKLNGATDHVTFQGSLDLPVYSMAVWFRVEGGTGARDIISVYNNEGAHGALLEMEANGRLRFLHRAPVGATTGDVNCRNSGQYDDGTWYHAAIVRADGEARLYINGVLAHSLPSVTTFDQVLPRMTIGVLKHDSLSRYFPGDIDEVYIYNRVLSQDEIAYLAGRTMSFDK